MRSIRRSHVLQLRNQSLDVQEITRLIIET
jgi:hypothetical protein